MKDMSKVYLKMETAKLRTLRSKKMVELNKLRGYQGVGYFLSHDKAKLSYQITAIDAVLESRKLQTELPL